MKLSELQQRIEDVAEEAEDDPAVLTNVDPNRGYNVYDITSVDLVRIENEDDLGRCRVKGAEIGEEFVYINFLQ